MVFNEKVSKNEIFGSGKIHSICMNSISAKELDSLDLVRKSLKSMFIIS